jgi:7,8-dihydropterin-6-yl-methyl-4-(beta-D-ribofuranosyl)aminobenzene 5'-phosphate synthase
MKISILTDNHPGSRTPAEHGLSYLIEYDGKKLLFDTGQSDMFLRNAATMNLNLTDINLVILSHGHYDHGDGLSDLTGGSLLCHPGCFVKRYRKRDHTYIGLKSTKSEIEQKFNLVTSSEPYKITERIIFLGQIPRITDFESNTSSFVFEDEIPDFVQDDSAVVLLLTDGLFIITGCGHAGIVNTLEYAKKVAGTKKLIGIMGGFHLKEVDLQTTETIRYLKGNNIEHVYPSHCTGLPALSAFYQSFGMPLIKTGDIMDF